MHQVCTLNSISFQPFTIYHAIHIHPVHFWLFLPHFIRNSHSKMYVQDKRFWPVLHFFRSECPKSRGIFQHSKIFNKKKFGIPLLIFFSNYSSIKYKLVQSCVFDRYMYTCINYSCILLHVRIWNVRRHF